jgi:RNA polymerase sigma factor (sigma-70 family)
MSRSIPAPSTEAFGPPLRRRGSHAAPSKAAAATRGRALLETHLELIQRKLQRLSWRSGLPACDAEEFRSWAILKLIDDEYRILGKWEGRSSFPTYLTVVLVNLMRDYRIHIWGKWRPSAASRRLGQKGVLLERLLVRDGLTGEEAAERLRTEHGIALSPDELVKLADTFPQRPEQRRESEEELAKIPTDGQVEVRIEEEERARTANRLCELLIPLLKSLPAEDRLLLKLHFFEGLSIAAIAPILRRPQRELYSARDRCLKKLRRSLDEAGLGADQIRELLGRLQGNLGLEAHLRGLDGALGREKVAPVRLNEYL